METLDWLEKNKETRSMEVLDDKIREVENEVNPIMEALQTKIVEAGGSIQRSGSQNIGGLVSVRSKLMTPIQNK